MKFSQRGSKIQEFIKFLKEVEKEVNPQYIVDGRTMIYVRHVKRI
jgi:hypothetical protein